MMPFTLPVLILFMTMMTRGTDTTSDQCSDPSDQFSTGSCVKIDTLTDDWHLAKIEFENSHVVAKRHILSSMVVSGPGSGTFSASGSRGQRATLYQQNGPKIPSDRVITIEKPEVDNEGGVSISIRKYEFSNGNLVNGLPNVDYMGSWNCKAEAGETKQCYAYMNEFHVSTKYSMFWENSGTGCSVKSGGEIVQELWGQPIVQL